MKLTNDRVVSSKNTKIQSLKNLKSVLTKGDRFTALIVKVDGENVILKVGTEIFTAKNYSSETLFEGIRQDFDVISSGDNASEIVVKPSVMSELSPEKANFDFINDSLSKLGISFSEKNSNILAKMLKQNHPISSTAFNKVKTLLNQNGMLTREVISTQKSDSLGIDFNSEKLTAILSLEPKEILESKTILTMFKSVVYENESNLVNETVSKQNETTNGKENNVLSKDIKADSTKSSETIKSDSKNVKTDIKFSEILHQKNVDISTDLKNENALKKVKQFVNEFLKFSNTEIKQIETVVFLSKLNLKPTIFNQIFASKLLSEDVGLSNLLLDYISSDKQSETNGVKQELTNLVKDLFAEVIKQEDLDSEDLKTFIKKSRNVLNNVVDLLELDNVKDEISEVLLKNTSNFVKATANAFETIVVPYCFGDEVKDVEVFIKDNKKSKNATRDSEDKLVYLALNTLKMDRVKVRVDYGKDEINILFMIKDKSVKKHFSDHIIEFKSIITSCTDKDVNVLLNQDDENKNFIELDSIENSVSTRINTLV